MPQNNNDYEEVLVEIVLSVFTGKVLVVVQSTVQSMSCFLMLCSIGAWCGVLSALRVCSDSFLFVV